MVSETIWWLINLSKNQALTWTTTAKYMVLGAAKDSYMCPALMDCDTIHVLMT
jgi:hypothetical protein